MDKELIVNKNTDVIFKSKGHTYVVRYRKGEIQHKLEWGFKWNNAKQAINNTSLDSDFRMKLESCYALLLGVI